MGELKSTVLMANNSIEHKLIRECYLFSLSSQISGDTLIHRKYSKLTAADVMRYD